MDSKRTSQLTDTAPAGATATTPLRRQAVVDAFVDVATTFVNALLASQKRAATRNVRPATLARPYPETAISSPGETGSFAESLPISAIVPDDVRRTTPVPCGAPVWVSVAVVPPYA